MDFGHVQCCAHIRALQSTPEEIRKLDEDVNKCWTCDYYGTNLWICLKKECRFVGCPETASDHSTEHYYASRTHCVHMNVSSKRIWCYACEREVFLDDELASPSAVGQGREAFCMRSKPAVDGLVGLHNIANTCYMNSAIQALSNIPPMTHYFLECADLIDFKTESEAARCKAGLAKSYARLMDDMWCHKEADLESIVPRGILHGIRSVHPMFRGHQQHDTQEFLRCFMDQLHEELKESSNPIHEYLENSAGESKGEPEYFSPTNSLSESEYDTCDSSISNSSSTLCSGAALEVGPKKKAAAAGPSPANRSIITDIFDGKILSSVQCLACDRISTREETFQDLSLPIPTRDYLNVLHQSQSQALTSAADSSSQTSESSVSWMWNYVKAWLWGPSVTLHDCMASFFSADELKGDNMYSCEKCSKLRTGIKYSKILDLPEVLCIHLKRFRHDVFYSSKISSHVNFPLESFDMSAYVHKTCKSQVTMYNLVSVICHHGTVGGGHYTCMARNSNNKWYEFDDHHVTEVPADKVQNCQAYVLFYRKFNPQMDLTRSEANQISLSYPIHQSDIKFFVAREWLCRFNTFAEPGPINNADILCPHGGIIQSKIDALKQIAVPIPQKLWDFFYSKYGGGPAINMLYECEICKRIAETISRRQLYELSVFSKYNEQKADDDSSAIYAISMPWLRKWQQFVRGNTFKEPGPITNSDITKAKDPPPSVNCKYNVRPGSDYAQLTSPLWHFLHGIYGGGPEIILRESLTTELDVSEDDTKDPKNVSDTESNIGQDPLPRPRLHIVARDEREESISETSVLDVPSYAPAAYERHSDAMETSRSGSSAKKSKTKIRGILQKSDLFGTAGTYTQADHADTYDELPPKGAKSKSPEQPMVNGEVTVLPTSQPKIVAKGHRKKRRSRAKGKIKTDDVKLQKFSQLQESSESTETDA